MAISNVHAARDWFPQMQRLFSSARFSEAGDLYDAVTEGRARPSNDALLLRGRLYLKTDSKRAVPFLLRHELYKPTPAQVARRSMYLGTGYSRLGDFNEADKHFANAQAVFQRGATFAELATHISRRYLEQRDFELADQWQKKTLIDRSVAGKIRSQHLRSYILARQERYREQAQAVSDVLDLIGEKREHFAEDWYAAVHTLAVLAREMPVESLAKRARSEVDVDFSWSPDFATSRFQALKAVAWCRALAGDELSCFRYLRLAQHVNVGPVWKTILHLDRAYFASIVGEEQWAANEFSSAEDLAERIDWEETIGEERIALLLLAELATTHAPKRAPFYIARFNHLGKLRSNLQHFAFDDRLSAMAAYSTGLVHLASDDERAERFLRTAWGTFDRIGYDVRAALAAMALYRATRKARWLHLAEDKLEGYPHAWLQRKLSQLTPESTKTESLSKMQATVTQLVCRGLSTDAMAKELRLSRYTVLNHLKVIYRKLGVNSREGLVVEAMRRKLAQ
jgi:DNA-binding CsgD family transcriptional regulator